MFQKNEHAPKSRSGPPRAPAVANPPGRASWVAKAARTLAILSIVPIAGGCAKSSAEHLADARVALGDAAYTDALDAAQAGLDESPADPVAWGLELVRLEAHARLGDGDAVKALLAELARRYPDRLPATQYAATAHQLKSAGAAAAAIEVLDLGAKRYPQDALIAKMIGDASAGGGSPAELEMLRSLGYVE